MHVHPSLVTNAARGLPTVYRKWLLRCPSPLHKEYFLGYALTGVESPLGSEPTWSLAPEPLFRMANAIAAGRV